MAPFSPDQSEAAAASQLAEFFGERGWHVEIEPGGAAFIPDLMISRGSLRFAAELKSVNEGRPDRVLPLLSQAILQARRCAEGSELRPLAIVRVNHASPALHLKVAQFQRDYAADVAVGLISAAGASFAGDPNLEALNVDAPRSAGRKESVQPRKASELFSDLNQWMLKVLLAPELPEQLLKAPRGEYRSVSELAEAAQVSAMSASRFLRRLEEDGYLDDSRQAFQLVRRRELFDRWRSASMRSSPELRMSYVIPNSDARQLHKVASRLHACIGLFAAADLLQLGYVSGVAPYVYVRRLPASFSNSPGIVPVRPGEPAQLILKQSNVPESLFRGAVQIGGVLVSDVLQVWLDASSHPSRGAEQANHLKHKVLADVLGGGE